MSSEDKYEPRQFYDGSGGAKTDAGGVSLLDAERHPGPFSGPDAEFARACAMAVIPWYGNDDGVTHQRIMKDGVWNDHIAVQAALAAIHTIRRAGLLGSTPVPCDGEAVAWTMPSEEQLARFLCEQAGASSDFESYDKSHPIFTKKIKGWEIFTTKARGILAFLKRNAPPARSDAPLNFKSNVDLSEATRSVQSLYDMAGPRSDAGSVDDPTADARWNNGCEFAMMMLCNVLGVDSESVSWDAATETVDGDVQSVIGNIMRAKYGEDWDSKAPSPPPSGVREALSSNEQLRNAIQQYIFDGHARDISPYDVATNILLFIDASQLPATDKAGTEPRPAFSATADSICHHPACTCMDLSPTPAVKP